MSFIDLSDLITNTLKSGDGHFPPPLELNLLAEQAPHNYVHLRNASSARTESAAAFPFQWCG